MNVKECDRCGAIFDYEEVDKALYVYATIGLNNRAPYDSERLDLCPSCVSEMRAFLWGDICKAKEQRSEINRSVSIVRAVDKIKELYPYSFAKTEQA